MKITEEKIKEIEIRFKSVKEYLNEKSRRIWS
jgi:hypothetical protein